MKIYNEQNDKKETIALINDKQLNMYVCGPTVYNHVHIGNTRPMIVFDVFRRVFEYQGYDVKHVSNYTDVDDKIINEALKQGISEKELVERYIHAYEQVRDQLNVLAPTHAPRVTEYMKQIIQFIEVLIEKGFAYQADGDVFFRVSKLDNYGYLSNQNLEDLEVGARIASNDKKENPLDFTLWKQTEVGLNFESPFSAGRPGWHTECVVMIHSLFKDGKVDIHGGGHDLKFPHHENEEAQSMAYSGHGIANYWVHNQLINIDNQKMSKSIGNVLWAKDVVSELGVNVYRWLMLSTHYRNPLNFSDELVSTVKKEVDKVVNVFKQSSLIVQQMDVQTKVFDQEVIDAMIQTLNDDLNTSNALTMILDQVKVLNQEIRSKDKNGEIIAIKRNTLVEMLNILGFVFKYPILTAKDFDDIIIWEQMKVNKQFIEADELRNQLIVRGII